MPVVFEQLLELVTLVTSCVGLGDDLVLDEVCASLSIGPGVPNSVIGGIPVVLHGGEEAGSCHD